jgi:hypothetical protein
LKRRRVVAYVTRVRDGQTELLVFEDPAGTGLLREIAEETVS